LPIHLWVKGIGPVGGQVVDIWQIQALPGEHHIAHNAGRAEGQAQIPQLLMAVDHEKPQFFSLSDKKAGPITVGQFSGLSNNQLQQPAPDLFLRRGRSPT
jgi:hypothetical protein